MFNLFFPEKGQVLPVAPGWFQHVFSAICILSILLPAGTLRYSSGALIFSLLFYLLIWTGGNSSNDFLIANGCTIHVYRWLDLIVFNVPERDFWKVPAVPSNHEDVERERRSSRAPEGKCRKLLWFAELWFANRGVGWNIRSPSTPPSAPANYPKSLFLRESASHTLTSYLLFDLATYGLTLTSTSTPFYSLPLTTQLLIAYLTILAGYFSIEFMYTLLSFISISCSLSTPASWPPISGSFLKDGYTIRSIWGKCWHQIMLRPCSEAGRRARDFLGFKKGSVGSGVVQLWVGFAASALLHQMGALKVGFEDGGFWQAVYFMAQPVGIMMEGFVVFMARKAGLKGGKWSKTLGFIWVILWFSWSLRFMVAAYPVEWRMNLDIPNLTGAVIAWLGGRER